MSMRVFFLILLPLSYSFDLNNSYSQKINSSSSVSQKKEIDNNHELFSLRGGTWTEAYFEPQYSLPNGNDCDTSTTQGLILMDSFCPYHGGYLSHKAKTAYNAGIVHTVSDYVINCLLNDDDDTDDNDTDQYVNAQAPQQEKHVLEWLKSIPFDVVGIICESDSGLDDAEKLGVAIGLFPERHDGYNSE